MLASQGDAATAVARACSANCVAFAEAACVAATAVLLKVSLVAVAAGAVALLGALVALGTLAARGDPATAFAHAPHSCSDFVQSGPSH
jgi:hypothetical protein